MLDVVGLTFCPAWEFYITGEVTGRLHEGEKHQKIKEEPAALLVNLSVFPSVKGGMTTVTLSIYYYAICHKRSHRFTEDENKFEIGRMTT